MRSCWRSLPIQPNMRYCNPAKSRSGPTRRKSHDGLILEATKKTQQPVDFDTILSIVKLVAMVHGETPAGHDARAEMPALIKQTTKLLNGPKILVALRDFHFYEYGRKKPPKPTEWVNKHVGKDASQSERRNRPIR